MSRQTKPFAARTIARAVVAGALCLALLGIGARHSAALPKLSPEHKKRLSDWQVIALDVKSDHGIPGGRAMGVIPHTPEKVFFALLGVDRYRYWVPHMKGSRFVKQRPAARSGSAVLESRLPWPARDAWAYITFSWEPLGGRRYRMRWSMRNGNLKAYRGWAEVYPWTGDAAHALVVFEVHALPNTSAPHSIIRKGIRKTSEAFVHRLRMRVQALEKYKKFPADIATRYRKK